MPIRRPYVHSPLERPEDERMVAVLISLLQSGLRFEEPEPPRQPRATPRAIRLQPPRR